MVAACVSLFEVSRGLHDEFRSVLRQYAGWLDERLQTLQPTLWFASVQYAGPISGLVSVHALFPGTEERATALDDVLVNPESPLSIALESPSAPARRAGQALYRSLDAGTGIAGEFPFVALRCCNRSPRRRRAAIDALLDPTPEAVAASVDVDARVMRFEFEEAGRDWGQLIGDGGPFDGRLRPPRRAIAEPG
ncbi:MAG: hypothetical protein U0360_07960 [Dehalococcoidia bacterium]